MGARLLGALTLVCALGCEPGVPPTTGADCHAAGDHLAALGCAEAATPEGVPFAEACLHAASDGRDWRPDCLALVDGCDDIETAYRTPRGAQCP